MEMEMEEVWRDDCMSSNTAPGGPAAHPSPPPSPPPSSYSYRTAGILQDFFAPAPQQPPTPPPLPPTALSLGGSSTSGDDPAAGTIFPFAAPAPQMMTSSSGGDRRHRRMIKNRESAARSRARKQAYTNQLELALAQLRRENAMLINLHQELNVHLATTAQAPDRPSVQRCRSAPP